MSKANFDKKFHNDGSNEEYRINWQIKASQVRLIKEDKQLGIIPIDAARRMAQDAGLDLVEVAPDARPPVCKIMDYGRFKYEVNLKKKEASKKQRESQVQLKQLRLRPGIGEHDIFTKINQAKRFLEDDNCRVQFNLWLKGMRELSHKEQGFAVMKKVIEALSSSGTLEKAPRMDGNYITCCLAPKI